MHYVWKSHLGHYFVTNYIKTPYPYYCKQCDAYDYIVEEVADAEAGLKRIDELERMDANEIV